jgi:hypothetical protein
VFLSLIALGVLLICSGGILFASQEWRVSASQALAARISSRFGAPSKAFEASMPEQEEILRELESGISSLLLLEPLTNTLRSLLGEAGGDLASASFALTVLREISSQRALVSERSPEQVKYLLRAGLAASTEKLELPLGLSGREPIEQELEEAGLKISASASLLDGTTRAWGEQLERTRALRQRIELVRADAAQFFGIGPLDEAQILSQQESQAPSSLHTHFYSSGLLSNFPILPEVPDGLESPESLRSAIVNAGGTALAADGTSAEERQARFAELQATGAALLKEAQELESTSESLIATMDQQAAELKTQHINKLHIYSKLLVTTVKDLSMKNLLNALPQTIL